MAIQKELAPLVDRSPLSGPVRFMAGLDAAFSKAAGLCFAAAVLWNVERQATVEERLAVSPLAFPYVPGLLSFREAPGLLAALAGMEHRPDLLLCDGQGIAHPRRFGIASHLGLATGLPSVGCGKSRLIGTHAEPGPARGDRVPLLDGTEVIGTVLRTRAGVKPVYVSIGHRIDLAGAGAMVLACSLRSRVPEPVRLAHRLASAAKRQHLG
ncbi:MAG: deoxyribonuclease V [Desulfobacteraceae bacterium]|nr:deoxyribonuclease V [Desulfobacteraceae bacterium]